MKSSRTQGPKAAKPAPAKTSARNAGKPGKSVRAGAGDPVLTEGGFSLEPVFQAARRQVPAAGQAEMAEFLGQFYRRLLEDEYPQHPPQAWAAIGVGMLGFARKRKPGTANVRVFNPTLKDDGWES